MKFNVLTRISFLLLIMCIAVTIQNTLNPTTKKTVDKVRINKNLFLKCFILTQSHCVNLNFKCLTFSAINLWIVRVRMHFFLNLQLLVLRQPTKVRFCILIINIFFLTEIYSTVQLQEFKQLLQTQSDIKTGIFQNIILGYVRGKYYLFFFVFTMILNIFKYFMQQWNDTKNTTRFINQMVNDNFLPENAPVSRYFFQ